MLGRLRLRLLLVVGWLRSLLDSIAFAESSQMQVVIAGSCLTRLILFYVAALPALKRGSALRTVTE
jgi:hypothetical protein